ncbi:MAG TPA: hypothetical protein VFI73_00725 [Candidatus Nitrosopolaris sp.]|nr:hypothetical protein [Candidatus Nitrosopolaris sp.]
MNTSTKAKRNKGSRAATRAKDSSIQRVQPYGSIKQISKKIRYLQLSSNVNDYDTGETESAIEKAEKTEYSISTAKKTGHKFQDFDN